MTLPIRSTHRGLSDYTRIIVYNWHWYMGTEVDMVKWDDSPFDILTNTVAIFKIKPKTV
jgi:hypothetical protein